MTPLGQAILTEVTEWFNDVTDSDEAERLDGALQAMRYLADRLYAMGQLPEEDRRHIWNETLTAHMPSALERYVEERQERIGDRGTDS